MKSPAEAGLFCQKKHWEVRSVTIFQHRVNCTNSRRVTVAPPFPKLFTAMRAHGPSRETVKQVDPVAGPRSL